MARSCVKPFSSELRRRELCVAFFIMRKTSPRSISIVEFYLRLLALLTLFGIFCSAIPAFGMGIKPPPGTTPKPTPKPSATPKPTPKPTPRPSATPAPPSSGFAAIWSGKHSSAADWDGFVRDAVSNYGAELLKGPDDISLFCPMYDRLGTQDRLNFWVQLVAAMTKFESNFKPTMRYTETSMGIDPITKKQVVSEGLLQLSYQDERNYKSVLPPGVCDFNYTNDQKYAITDIRRTIFDPKTNLTCGIFIMNRQILRHGKLGINSGAYWSVLQPKGSRLAEIKKITNGLSFCKR